MFEKVLNWKLLEGSHEFPGPDGGTCINEAAIVAAGFEYKKVVTCSDLPPCFSRPIAAYAIILNDLMPDKLRQKLLVPFVTRLAGTADNPPVELARMKLIAFRTIREILPFRLRAYGLGDHARRCEQVEGIDAAADAAGQCAARAAQSAARVARCAADNAGYVSADFYEVFAEFVAEATEQIATWAWATGDVQIFLSGVSILDEAIRLGKQAEPIDTALVVERMEKIKRSSPERV